MAAFRSPNQDLLDQLHDSLEEMAVLQNLYSQVQRQGEVLREIIA